MFVLLVDDNPGDIELLQAAMDDAQVVRTCHAVHDGDEAVKFLLRESPHVQAPRPDLIVMDLGLPLKSGIEVMKQFHHRPEFRKIPLVLMSGMTRDSQDCCAHWDEDHCLYLTKPLTFEGYVDAVGAIKEFLASLCIGEG